ncbi:MAG TPA: cytochrome c peroxidase [Myxococcales bacterium]|jgi:cytochrome c peroxidase|nr:cytochrome c peroxidase [Myxococcales bacterium]
MRHLLRPCIIGLICAAACGPNGDLTGAERSLLSQFSLGPLPLDPSNAKADDPAAASLGQQFFFDSRFSGPLALGDDGTNGATGPRGAAATVSCSSCHDPAHGGADARSRPSNTSLGSSWTGRNAPTVLNAAYSPWQFWDGRSDSLWSQALGPVESPGEHNFSRLEVAHLIAAVYAAPFQEVFGALPDLSDAQRFPASGKPGNPSWDQMTAQDQSAVNRVFADFGKAIEAYERTLIDRDSPFDRYMAGDEGALSAAAVRGARLFVGRASCNECHRGPNFTDDSFHNTGVPQVGSAAIPAADDGRMAGVSRLLASPFNSKGPYSDSPDAARLPTPALESARGAFKTPGLRGVLRTAPYMHTGGFATLRDVVVFYRDGGGASGFSGTKDVTMQPLVLSDADVDDMVAFLGSLSGAPLPAALTIAPRLP